MKSTDSEQEGVGMELEQYRNRLEQMVEEKSKDLIAIQENLEATNRRQALFIKVLQILQPERSATRNISIMCLNISGNMMTGPLHRL